MPRFDSVDLQFRRVDNGLYLISNGQSLDLKTARDIHLSDAHALIHEYVSDCLPHGTRLRVTHYMRHVQYVLWRGHIPVFRALYQLDNDELTDVRTRPTSRGKGYARAALGVILRIDGPRLITAGPSEDSPMGVKPLIKFYSSFSGYHSVPGTNKVIRLMQDTMIEEAAELGFGRRPKSMLELAVHEENSRELKRIMDILRPMNDEEIKGLLDAQATDILSLQTAMKIYDRAFFDSRPWGRAHRVEFARGMNNLLKKHTGNTYGVWDDIIDKESF